jgi:hypothetical protein
MVSVLFAATNTETEYGENRVDRGGVEPPTHGFSGSDSSIFRMI